MLAAYANTASFDDISLVREVTQTMEYDEDGNLKSVTTSGLNVDINTYDEGNLIKTVTGSQGVYKYDYDDTYTHRLMSVTNQNTENSPTEWITQSMVYDDYGNVISTTLSGPGNLTMSTSAEYTSNGNMLQSVTDATGAMVTYGYTKENNDSDGNSIMWGLLTTITAPNGTTTRTTYDLYGRVAQTSVADLATLLYNYSKGNLHEITRSYIKDGQEKTQTYTLDYDPFGNTTSIKVGTKVLASYTYGNTDGLLKERIYSNGHKVETTLYYLQSRYYDPEMGRFINADAFASTGQGVLGNNMFAYCGNNPVMYNDALGMARNVCMTSLNLPGSLYIYDQEDEPFDDIPYGIGSIGENGCGVIATYNAMISLGDIRTFGEIYSYLTSDSSKMLADGNMGTNPWAIADYFESQGYTVHSTYNRDEIELYSTVADACILLYTFKTSAGNYGGHYVEYSRTPSGYTGRNVNTNTGMGMFSHPSDYGYEGERFFVLGIFVFK